jgi:GNAT superfamily N-acetyltransferase
VAEALGAVEAVEGYWAGYLGCHPADLRRPGVAVVAPTGAGPGTYRGAHALRRGPTCVVSVQPGWVAHAARTLAGRPPDAVFEPAALVAVFGDAVEGVVGPAYVGYAADADAAPAAGGVEVRLLEAGDGRPAAPALRVLRAGCPPDEWEHSGIDPTRPPVFGAFVDGELVAAGKLQDLDGALVHVGVITHPAHRGRGHGRRVVGAMTTHALRAGLVPQYRTLLANAPALAVARALGYREYGRTLAVRLAAWSPTGDLAHEERGP